MLGRPAGKQWKWGSFESMAVVSEPVGRLDFIFSWPHAVNGSGPFQGLPSGPSHTNCCPGLSCVAAPKVLPVDGYQNPATSASARSEAPLTTWQAFCPP